jgi:hypothetical protein
LRLELLNFHPTSSDLDANVRQLFRCWATAHATASSISFRSYVMVFDEPWGTIRDNCRAINPQGVEERACWTRGLIFVVDVDVYVDVEEEVEVGVLS